MLIQIFEDPTINSIPQLYWRTHSMILEHRSNPNKAIVLGPISSKDPSVVRKNLEALTAQAVKLSDAGWIVVDIASFYNITERLIRAHKVVGYPFVVIEEFTAPLIRSGLFSVAHFRIPFEHSVGTTREHTVAQEYAGKDKRLISGPCGKDDRRIEIRYFT